MPKSEILDIVQDVERQFDFGNGYLDDPAEFDDLGNLAAYDDEQDYGVGAGFLSRLIKRRDAIRKKRTRTAKRESKTDALYRIALKNRIKGKLLTPADHEALRNAKRNGFQIAGVWHGRNRHKFAKAVYDTLKRSRKYRKVSKAKISVGTKSPKTAVGIIRK